jgi:hypothetical protein
MQFLLSENVHEKIYVSRFANWVLQFKKSAKKSLIPMMGKSLALIEIIIT